MEKIKVTYQSGESRLNPGKGIDFMIAVVDDAELYAEADPVEDEDTGSYEGLKAEILEQAELHDIAASRLQFWFDEPEGE